MSAEHPSVAERIEVGAAARRKVPLTDHGQWEPAPDRVDPVSILTAQDASRQADLVPIRHGRMAASPFAFFRGGAAIMAADLATEPSSGLVAQLCGDAHAVNFGLYASPERRLLFDVNDFDETIPGPFEWDVKRLAASIAIVAHDSHFSPQEVQDTTRATVAAYRQAMRKFADRSTLDVWYASIAQQDLRAAARSVRRQVLADDAAARRHKRTGSRRHDLTSKQAAKLAEAAERLVRNNIHRARMRTNLAALAQLTEVVKGRTANHRHAAGGAAAQRLGETGSRAADAIRETVGGRLATYAESLPAERRLLLSRYEVVDVARKVVGVGSVGMLDFIVLLQGRDVDDALFLQVKQAGRSVLADHLPATEEVPPGERVVLGQRLMQTASDLFLGWSQLAPGGESFYWRQLRDMKASPAVELMSPASLELHGRLCGRTLAMAHARSSDPVAIAAYLGARGGFDTAVTAFAIRYTQQNALDFVAFGDAIADGRIEAQQGV